MLTAALAAAALPGRTATEQATGQAATELGRAGRLPIVDWAFGDVGPPVVIATGVRYDAMLRYRLRGESDPIAWPVRLTVQHQSAGWRLTDLRSRGGRASPWEVGVPRVLDSGPVTAIGFTGPTAALRTWAQQTRLALGQAEAAVRRRVVAVTVVVLPSPSTFAAATGRTGSDVSDLAAVAMAEPAVGGRTSQQRIYINGSALAAAGTIGRLVVLRHELTHLLLRDPQTVGVPTWLQEGLAEVVGYQGSGIPLAVAADQAYGRPAPAAAPTDADFTGAGRVLAYERALVLCRRMADAVGVVGLVRLRALVAGGMPVARAWRRAAGTSYAEVLQAWRRDLHARVA